MGEVKVNFEAKQAKPKSAPKRRLKATEREYSKETLAESYKLYEDNDYLKAKLKEEDFHEACLYCGVLVETLPSRPLAFFSKLPNRVRKLDDFESNLRKEEYDRIRLDNLRQIVEREKEC